MNGYIDNNNFSLIDFIKNHKDWEILLKKKPYNLKAIKNCVWEPNWWMFVYNLFDSELTDPVVRNCRGVVLSIDGDKVEPVSVPYTKFFGYNDLSGKDIEDSINWNNAKFQLKEDGILIKTACVIKNGEKRLCFFTNGSFDLNAPFEDSFVYDEPETRGSEYYGDLLSVAIKKIDSSVNINFNKEYGWFYITGGFAEYVPVGSTLMFELVSPRNKIICEYKETKLYLHGYRGADLVELDPRTIIPKLIPIVSFEYPELLDASNYDDLKKLLSSFNGNEKEGCVVVDYSTPGIPRAKIKCDSYLKLKFVKDTSCNTRVLFKAVIFDEYDDLLSAVPEAASKVEEIKENIAKLKDWFIQESIVKVPNICTSEDPKENKKLWALWCKENVPKELFSFYMLMNNFDCMNKLNKRLENLSIKKDGYSTVKDLLSIVYK